MNKVITIDKEKAKNFNIPIKSNSIKVNDIINIFIEDISDDEDTIFINGNYSLNRKKLKNPFIVTYEIKNLKPYESFFIGWSYLSIWRKDPENYLKKAEGYLWHSIQDGINSCLPLYLLAEYPFRNENNVRLIDYMHYALDNSNDLFPDFYLYIYRNDNNEIRAINALKKGIDNFPKNINLVFKYSSHLIEIGNYKDALSCLENVDKKSLEEFDYYLYYRVKIISLLNLKKYSDIEDIIIKAKELEKYEKALLKGLLYYKQNVYSKASEKFINSIENNFSSKKDNFCYYYLLDCYHKLDDFDNLIKILDLIPEQEDEEEYIECSFGFSYSEIAEEVLRDINSLNIDETYKAKAQGFLASLLIYENILNFDIEPEKRKLSKKEILFLKEAEQLIKEAISYSPSSYFYQKIYSDILFLKGKYDEAERIIIKSLITSLIEKHKSNHLNDLRYCSDGFLNNFLAELEHIFKISEDAEEVYAKYQLCSDIYDLFILKKYKSIVELYEYYKDNLRWITNYNYSEETLFRIAYSLAEEKELDEAEYIYKKSLEVDGKYSSTFNNLALIYEELSNLNKAEKNIRKAKDINQKDGFEDISTDINYNRIIKKVNKIGSNKETDFKKGSISEIKVKRIQKEKLYFDTENGEIVYANKKCPLRIGSNQYYLCKLIFEKPFGTKVREDIILEEIDRSKSRSEYPRTIYDAHLLINKKVNKFLGITKLLEYGSARVWIREELFN